jgi:hypothetical protein
MDLHAIVELLKAAGSSMPDVDDSASATGIETGTDSEDGDNFNFDDEGGGSDTFSGVGPA